MNNYKELMTLDDAILHAEEKAHSLCGECAEEHKQLAEWLRELKTCRGTIERLAKDNAVLAKEKDAAVGYLKKYARRCRICKHFNKKSSEIGSVCKTCKNYDENFFEDRWEWGGAQE